MRIPDIRAFCLIALASNAIATLKEQRAKRVALSIPTEKGKLLDLSPLVRTEKNPEPTDKSIAQAKYLQHVK